MTPLKIKNKKIPHFCVKNPANSAAKRSFGPILAAYVCRTCLRSPKRALNSSKKLDFPQIYPKKQRKSPKIAQNNPKTGVFSSKSVILSG